MQKKKTAIFLLTFFILLSAAFMTYFYKTTRETPKTLPVLGNPGHVIDTFAFTNQEGKIITDKDVAGKIFVVEYFFTTCKGICPKMNENMTKVYQAFRGNKDVMILSHTVDPKKDTVAAMKEYSLRFDADPKQWIFLTGDKKALYDHARYSYLVTAADDTATTDIQSDFIHTNRFMLVDRGGRIRGSYDGTNMGDVNQLIGDIKILEAEKE
ncbi:SCO family protein [Taibaiella soli]|uniref:SCO family protein n=1 Tax=Taibaiella soli TaxID=1649169 RepID=A0A2W2BW36_9BACT|nr:SCO family protein [Taibaiella soli]PZF72053.1 SCO family protein [Taibaiella soli]